MLVKGAIGPNVPLDTKSRHNVKFVVIGGIAGCHEDNQQRHQWRQNWHNDKAQFSVEAEWRIYASVNFPPLVQIMACRLVGAKPLSEPMLEYC